MNITSSRMNLPKKTRGEKLTVQKFETGRKMKPKKIVFIGIVILFLTILGYGTYRLFLSPKKSSQANEKNSLTRTITIDKTYNYSITGAGTSKLVLSVQKAEKTNTVMAKGEQVTAPNGKQFLAVYMEWNNETTKDLKVSSANYYRYLDSQNKLHAPAFYNNDVSVAPLSITTDKVAFVLNEGEKTIKLQVGDLNGQKEVIELKFVE